MATGVTLLIVTNRARKKTGTGSSGLLYQSGHGQQHVMSQRGNERHGQIKMLLDEYKPPENPTY